MKNGVKNVQTEGYNGGRTVVQFCILIVPQHTGCPVFVVKIKKCQNPFKDAKVTFSIWTTFPTACRYYLIILATLMAMTPTLLTQFLA